VLDALPLADVLGHELSVTGVVTHAHALAAAPADGQTLQQGGALTRRALASLGAVRLRVLVQALKVCFVLLPGEVAGVGSEDQRVPFLARQLTTAFLAAGQPASPAAPVGEGARVTRVLEHPQGATVQKQSPGKLALVRAAAQAAREQETLLAEAAHRSRGRTRAAEAREEGAQGLLHLEVGVEDDPSRGVIEEAHGKLQLKLAAARLGALAAEEASAQHVQLRF
jgi:hypothetical protein